MQPDWKSSSPIMMSSDHPFWEFSLQLYARPGVADTSLALQDRFDADVNMLFFAVWAGESRRALNVPEISELIAEVAPWRDGVVRPLRGARRFLKTTDWKSSETDSLRRKIQSEELAAERLQQIFLEARLDQFAVSAASREDCVAQNLENYAAAIDTTFPEELVAVLMAA
jgi:uncharacterized protein (TIGR02444 family)